MKRWIRKLFGYEELDDRKVWVYRAIATQGNAAGGAIVIDVTPGVGNYIELVQVEVKNSGTNGVAVYVLDISNNYISTLANVGSGSATSARLPSIGAVATSSGNTINSVGHRTYGTDKLSAAQSGAGAQNDTLTITIRGHCLAAPTVSKARSTNAADVTLTESYNALLDSVD